MYETPHGLWTRGWFRYGIAVAAVGAGFLLQRSLAAWFGPGLPLFLTFYPAVMAAAVLAGFGPGVLATVVSAVVVDQWLITPGSPPLHGTMLEVASLALFSLMGISMSGLAELFRRGRAKLAAYEKEQVLQESQEAFRERAEQHRLALEAGRLGTWEYNVVKGELYWDDRCRSLFGVVKGGTISYAEALDRLPEADRKDADRAFQAALAPDSQGVFELEHRVVWPDGSVHWLASKGQVFFRGNGSERKPIRLIGTLQDVTERWQTEQTLRKSEEQLRMLLEYSNDAILWADAATGIILRCNRKAEALTERTRGELIGMHQTQLHPADRDYAEIFRRATAAPAIENVEAELLGRSGRRIPVLINSSVVTFGEQKIIQGVFRDVTERKRAEKALRESREDLNRAQAVAHVGSWRLDVRKNELLWSDENWRIFGLPRGTPLNYETFLGTVHPQDHNYVHARWMAALRGEPFDIEHRIIVGDTVKWVREQAVLELDAHGAVLSGFGITQDITERKQSDEALRESEARFRALFEQAAVGVAQIDAHTGRFIQANRKYATIVGYSPQEMQALTFQQITHPEDLAKCLDNVRRLREGGLRDFAMEKRYIHKNGSGVWVNITVSPMWQPSDKPASHIVVVEDINERKKAEAALAQVRGNLEQMVEQRTARLNHMVQRLRWAVKVRREVERQIKEAEFRYRTVADFAYDWEYWKTPDGLLFYCSPSCERITGYTPSEMSTNPGLIAQLVHPQDKENWTQHNCDAMAEPGHRTAAFRIQRKNGEVRWIEHSCRPVIGSRGEFLGVRASNRDVTERKQAEMDMQRLREDMARIARITAAGQLSASLAHELNQPFGAIVCNVQAALEFLSHTPPELAEVKEALQDIEANTQRAGGVIHQLRGLYRKTGRVTAEVQFNDIIQGTAQLLHSEFLLKQVATQLELDPGLPTVNGNAVELQQVVLNLITNALDAMSAREPGARRLHIRTARTAQGHVCASFNDSGSGLPQALLAHIFEPFFTTKGTGMGMGLSICQSIIEAHGGTLRAENNPDCGATFHLTIPPFAHRKT